MDTKNPVLARAHLFISGDVIGVGFRAWTDWQAKRLNLTGWVRNTYPEVEVVFEGKKADIEKMIKRTHHGPQVGFVEEVRVVWEDYRGEFDNFTIRK